jgi:hypothetical protein
MADVKSKKPTYTTDFIPASDARHNAFLGNPVIDGLVNTVIALGTELWATKRRAKIVESLLAAKRPVTKETIEAYVPTPEEEKAWQQERDEMIKATYGSFAVAVNTAGAPSTKTN